VGRKQLKFAPLLARYNGHDRDPRYLAFFDCFNTGRYFEAHEVLENLWLEEPGPDYGFYKGLIQLAGAFVHVQKHRPAPASALLKLAAANLSLYGATHHGLDLNSVLELTRVWLERVQACGQDVSPLDTGRPELSLQPGKT